MKYLPQIIAGVAFGLFLRYVVNPVSPPAQKEPTSICRQLEDITIQQARDYSGLIEYSPPDTGKKRDLAQDIQTLILNQHPYHATCEQSRKSQLMLIKNMKQITALEQQYKKLSPYAIITVE